MQTVPLYSPPTWHVTRWLAEPPAGTPDAIRMRLIAELFSGLPVFFGGLLATFMASAIVVAHDPRPIFVAWLALEVMSGLVRVAILVLSRRRAARGLSTPTNLHLMMSISWASTLGFGTFVTLASGDWMVATMVCVPAAAMIGGICFRNVAVPRLATVMMVLSLGPLAFGALVSGQLAVMSITVLVPLFIFTMSMATFAMNHMLVSTMVAEQESGHRAHHDDLTGLANRAKLTARLDQRFARLDRRGESFAVLYLDLDGFKAVNDTHGHAAGDRLLQMVADRLNGLMRPGDITARIGGDEFVMLIDHIGEEEAIAFGERLIAQIARSYEVDGSACAVGVSVGIACAPQHGVNVTKLLAAADAALYSAKALGRGRVAVATAPQAVDPVIVPLVPALHPAVVAGDRASVRPV